MPIWLFVAQPVFNHKILYEPSVSHSTYITAVAIILSLPPPLVPSFFFLSQYFTADVMEKARVKQHQNSVCVCVCVHACV